MFRIILFGVLTCLSSMALALDNLHIKAGKPFVIDASMAQLKLKSLTIDEKAVIEIAPGVDLWTVDAESANIGFGVVVKGAGRNGAAGISGGPSADAKSCDIAATGKTGGRGGNGSNGVDVRWSIGVNKMGSIHFDISGGSGGNGGNGGDGQNLPNVAGCRARGGDAGNGGAGGNGGNGGSIRFHYWVNSEAVGDLSNSVHVKINGGKAGKGGGPGFPGVGAEGRFETKKSLSGNKVWVAGGGDGRDGYQGRDGSPGVNGGLDVRRIYKDGAQPAPEPEPVTEVTLNPTDQASLEQRVKELEILVTKLEARIKVLEIERR